MAAMPSRQTNKILHQNDPSQLLDRFLTSPSLILSHLLQDAGALHGLIEYRSFGESDNSQLRLV